MNRRRRVQRANHREGCKPCAPSALLPRRQPVPRWTPPTGPRSTYSTKPPGVTRRNGELHADRDQVGARNGQTQIAESFRTQLVSKRTTNDTTNRGTTVSYMRQCSPMRSIRSIRPCAFDLCGKKTAPLRLPLLSGARLTGDTRIFLPRTRAATFHDLRGLATPNWCPATEPASSTIVVVQMLERRSIVHRDATRLSAGAAGTITQLTTARPGQGGNRVWGRRQL